MLMFHCHQLTPEKQDQTTLSSENRNNYVFGTSWFLKSTKSSLIKRRSIKDLIQNMPRCRCWFIFPGYLHDRRSDYGTLQLKADGVSLGPFIFKRGAFDC